MSRRSLAVTCAYRLTIALGEHPVALVPLGARVLALAVLRSAVRHDQDKQLVWQRDTATACLGLHVGFDQAAAVPLGARAGVAGAVGRTGRRACTLVPLAARRG